MNIKEAWNCKCIEELRKKHLCNDIKDTICDNYINGIFKKVSPLDCKLATNFCEYQLDLPQKLIK